ncbi:MAG: glycine/betaine/sarcosine/D-proline family reductase selenoprotein B [Proteobacteria bacterium]|nr:glycine/betaine/sarcosine/D-proline family reductase selenoprotein B [Pseudomonadota bacterium]
MARLELMPESERSYLTRVACPEFSTRPWAAGPPLAKRRVALVSTAGLHRRDDSPFTGISGEYRVIPSSILDRDLIMSHVSVNFDRIGFQQDWNLVFPLDRLNELAREGAVGGVADFHYSFMGAADPAQLEAPARDLAALLKQDRVDAVLLIPV